MHLTTLLLQALGPQQTAPSAGVLLASSSKLSRPSRHGKKRCMTSFLEAMSTVVVAANGSAAAGGWVVFGVAMSARARTHARAHAQISVRVHT